MCSLANPSLADTLGVEVRVCRDGIGSKIPYFRGDWDRNDLDPSFNSAISSPTRMVICAGGSYCWPASSNQHK